MHCSIPTQAKVHFLATIIRANTAYACNFIKLTERHTNAKQRGSRSQCNYHTLPEGTLVQLEISHSLLPRLPRRLSFRSELKGGIGRRDLSPFLYIASHRGSGGRTYQRSWCSYKLPKIPGLKNFFLYNTPNQKETTHPSYTLPHPGAVVVKLFYAVVADAAVARARGTVKHARVAVLDLHRVAVNHNVLGSR